MASADRYKIQSTIAKGDFATVFQARDEELGRDIAVKQIHQQYLDDPRQLDRYWQEAQLLASLEHPHIMTIYDVVREKGWLILELAQGSLQQLLGGNAIDLKDLRLAMIYAARGLGFMHEHGIVHGDVKPTNLLVDRNHRVKLGDFGIARHMKSGDGSVVKGTTKYMAPEVVSDQFGDVGPHSDLYSLGFTAYELMCGENFESLFPGLNMYGRDRQMAWMMWHAAADRRLPEIERVLEGVPPDLVHVIQKLTEKDPARRYQTAEQVLADLEAEGEVVPPASAEEQAAAEAEQKSAQRRRTLTISVAVLSLLLSVGMLFLPGGQSEPPPAATETRPRAGTIAEIDVEAQRIFVMPAGGTTALGITIDSEKDRITLNDARAGFDDLQTGDVVSIRYLSSDDGTAFKELEAARELAVAEEGGVEAIDPYVRSLTVKWLESGTSGDVSVGDAVPITLNGAERIDDRRVKLSDLKADDRVLVHHKSGEEGGRVAERVDALREVSLGGFVLDAAEGQLKVRVARQWDSPEAEETTLPVAGDCAITLNGADEKDGRPLRLADLRPQDSISIRHDAEVLRIEAFRDVSISGTISDIQHAAGTFSVTPEGDSGKMAFRVAPDCRIEIEGEQQAVDFDYLRKDDRITVQRKSPDPENREAALISVAAEADPRAWAIVIGHDKYDNPRMPKIPYASKDIERLQDVFRVQYRVPSTQLLFEHNATRPKLETSLPAFLSKVASSSQLLVYFLGHGYEDRQGEPYLVVQGFDERRAANTGLSLDWLLEQMESSAAREKVLLLDTTHESESRLPDRYPSASELALAVKDGPNRPVSTSVTVIAASEAGQRSVKLQDQESGLFASVAVAAWKGKADRNDDHRVSVQELFTHLNQALADYSLDHPQRQTPVMFLPDATPPRLTDEAKVAIRGLLGYLRRRPDERVPVLFQSAKRLAAGQPEADLAYGLVELTHDRTVNAFRSFDAVRLSHPDSLLAYHALAWQHFMRREFREGIAQLVELVRRLPEEPTGKTAEYVDHLQNWAGKMAGYARVIGDDGRRLTAEEISPLNNAIRDRGQKAMDLYRDGYSSIFEKNKKQQEDIEDAFSDREKSALQRDLTRMTFYLNFDFDQAETYIQEQMEL